MAFDTFVFLQFFVALLLLYWLVRRSLQARNLLIVAASYLFYGWWDYRFLALILFSSLLDFAVGLALEREAQPRRRKGWLLLSLTGNLGVLGFFKYYDFFVESFGALATKLGWPVEARTLNIILPVGISFYTFQTMSYALDVYRRQMPATRSLTNFLAYVSFFPQLVAGPIERAQHLLPQFERTRNLTRPMLEEGVWLILWGLFKKVALADNFAPLVEMAYEQPAATAPVVVLGTIAFGLQIYCDFSGYSDIARGLARVLGFDIMVNFDVPYAAASLREFWRRWHISLSSWLRDYLYISLGGNRCGEGRTYLNLLLTMLLGGLWHGASWNFALWGLWHGLGLAVERRFGAARPRGPDGSALTLQRSLCWASTMLFVFYGWLLFRARSLEQIATMTRSLSEWTAPTWLQSYLVNLIVFAAPLVLIETWQIKARNRLAPLALLAPAKALLQGALLLGILLYWDKEHVPFIYFQF